MIRAARLQQVWHVPAGSRLAFWQDGDGCVVFEAGSGELILLAPAAGRLLQIIHAEERGIRESAARNAACAAGLDPDEVPILLAALETKRLIARADPRTIPG